MLGISQLPPPLSPKLTIPVFVTYGFVVIVLIRSVLRTGLKALRFPRILLLCTYLSIMTMYVGFYTGMIETSTFSSVLRLIAVPAIAGVGWITLAGDMAAGHQKTMGKDIQEAVDEAHRRLDRSDDEQR